MLCYNIQLTIHLAVDFECMRNGIFGIGACNGTELGEMSFIIQGC